MRNKNKETKRIIEEIEEQVEEICSSITSSEDCEPLLCGDLCDRLAEEEIEEMEMEEYWEE